MIESPERLWHAIEQMRRMHSLLASCWRDLLRKNRSNFADFAGPVGGIGKLQAQIDDYVRQLEGALA